MARISGLTLERPDFRFRDSFLHALGEFNEKKDQGAWIYLGDNYDFTAPTRDFRSYVDLLLSTESKALPGFVKNTAYWALCEGEVVGRISIRHELNDFLARAGGHVGYIVRPSYRRQGVATEMLRLILETDHAKTIGNLLLTCDESNLASEKTIVANGGVFEGLVENPGGERKKRFWIKV